MYEIKELTCSPAPSDLAPEVLGAHPAPSMMLPDTQDIQDIDKGWVYWCNRCEDYYDFDPTDPRCPCGARPGD